MMWPVRLCKHSVVPAFVIRTHTTACKPSNNRHRRLKQAEMECETIDAPKQDAGGDGCGIHGQANRYSNYSNE